MKHVLVSGAAGTLGSYLPDESWIVRTDKPELDVSSRGAVASALDEFQPDFFLHLAAETDVDLCEQEPERAFRVNALGTANVAMECAARGVTLLYVSTAGVFGGSKPTAYNEFDNADPANVYGESKLAGERFVQQMCPLSYIARAGWMIGGGPNGEKKFIAKMLERASKTGKIVAVDDKIGSPTYAKQFAAGMLRLIETGDFGLYHMVNQGACSRFEVAVEVNRLLGEPYAVEPAASSIFPLPAPRARSEVLDNLCLRLRGHEFMSDWRPALAEYIETDWAGWSP